MICPLRQGQYGSAEICSRADCAWWTGNIHGPAQNKDPNEVGMCAVLDIAIAGEGLRYDMMSLQKALSGGV